jgi:hypothetical protein
MEEQRVIKFTPTPRQFHLLTLLLHEVGYYPSSISFDFLDGKVEDDEVAMVGNNKVWSSKYEN